MTGEWARVVILLDHAQLECAKLTERLVVLAARLENIRATLNALVDQLDRAEP